MRAPLPQAEAAAAPEPVSPAAALSQRIVNLGSLAELEAALLANGLAPAEAAAASAAAQAAIGARPGEIRAVIYLDAAASAPRLMRLEASFLDSSGAVVTRQPDDTFAAQAVAASLSSEIIMRRGEMNDADFYSSAVAAGVTDSLIQTFAQAFVYDFNFQTEITVGDVFEAVFEQQVNASKQPVGAPRLLYAALTTSAKSKALYRFQPPGGEPGWFDGNGRSVKRSFMRTPVDGARITSRFGPRFHPVLHYNRLHGGIDLAAPVGTPIYASAAGTVVSASPSSCAGNMVVLKHDNGWETRYFHLHQFAPDIAPGMRLAQGHQLGGVGNTGTCTTGPHLHYEVHIDGDKVDPESIPTEEGEALEGEVLKAFITERDRIDGARAGRTG
ncbi:M23 family metallopeptidase [Novosphingobium sp.]|uniref:M23 family metallopeptidase n=1 Tax=Novosphingobium sp. TaxID=1874826 RepID=UPI0027331609|nr:M23 family metallopeptidase [Novosphingobium sp.]MDP3908199.1 M23 family metallopeptidase [Novosphingobium sp.]